MAKSPASPHFGENGNPVNVIFNQSAFNNHRYIALHDCKKTPQHQWSTGTSPSLSMVYVYIYVYV